MCLFFSFLKWFSYLLWGGRKIGRFASAHYFGANSELSFQRGWLQHYDGNDDGDDVNGHVLTLETKVRLKPVHCDQHSKPFVCQLSAPSLLLSLLLSNCCRIVVVAWFSSSPSWSDLEFVKKFTRPNFPAKEFYTLKMRKSRLFLPAVISEIASLSVI